MCHKAPNPSSLAHTHTHMHTYTLLRWRKRGNRGDREDGVEDWGSGGETDPRCASWCRAPESWLILYHLSHRAHTHTHIRTQTPPARLLGRARWRTHTQHAGVTVRRMTGGSSRCNSPSWPNTDSSRHLRQLPLSRWGRANLKTGVKKKKKRKNQQLQNWERESDSWAEDSCVNALSFRE